MIDHTQQLHLPGRLVLWALRHWCRAARVQRDLPRFVRATLTKLPDGDQLELQVALLFAQLSLGARRPIWLRAPESQRLSRDESALMGALIAARMGLVGEVRLSLAELQQATGLRIASGVIKQLGHTMACANLSVAPCARPTSWQPDPALITNTLPHALPGAERGVERMRQQTE